MAQYDYLKAQRDPEGAERDFQNEVFDDNRRQYEQEQLQKRFSAPARLSDLRRSVLSLIKWSFAGWSLLVLYLDRANPSNAVGVIAYGALAFAAGYLVIRFLMGSRVLFAIALSGVALYLLTRP